MTSSAYHVFETAFGFCGAGWSEAGLARFILPTPEAEPVERLLKQRLPVSRAAQPAGAMADLVAAAQRYFDGSQESFSSVPLDLSGVSPFHHALYTAMRRLAYGETTTYGALCESVGFPKATRETGAAMGQNPVPLIIPCHRVLAAGGRIGGFSAHGGITTKQKMLALENARSPNALPAQGAFSF
ncbi:methylated-DNA--[protein]-cysteine S-methyltransferase [Nitratireductor sp. L1-7-SE]|uniref:Methylated-DNA--[protein]-cysteine S-methyltransferase n=1 Tax=Nitratireductor rhodophyticola TaxID=2854036 RepID=A0ABS7R8Z3_9HYPH|nr:methylated-DNA--[protein]-cysteine S-methyltransferase [Nitratireductor rhodophyticola]MBY8917403.1 methylated-DNA--[protein]-cysteine S-methyltransferase [Nitratireductor rhodophyticola]MBY8922114.1 methylated-DNA--[protein]-cysteine S-methyltransferase [Nitratireductor rhodophyticola]